MTAARDQDGAFQQPDLFRILLDQSTDAIEVVDPETLRLLDVNQTACVQLGYSREEMLSMSIFDLDPNLNEVFAPVWRDSCESPDLRCLRQNADVKMDRHFRWR